jgi:mitogen-activated protein kinase kinase kinase 7
LLIGAICGSVVIVALLFFILRLRSSRKKEEAFAKQATPYLLEDTVSFDQSKDSQEPGINSTLVNDPIIITHRIPHDDVKVATCISRGGFGLVYSGTFNRRRVAIKRIRPELSAEIKYIESFLKEICLMASLQHPRIVEFVGVAWDSLRNLSAVTEFMECGDLRDVLQSSKERNARLSWDGHKARIAMHIAEALTYLHSLSPKVIHRDLKSKNVLLDCDLTAKLSDFGVSRERRFEETHMTAGIGTAFWIAPEVLLGMDYDERADIFSFGVVLSEIDTDDYPYWNEKNHASGGKQQENVILRMVATGALRPEFSPTCPSAIVALGQSCFDVDPQKRPTAAEIVYCLQQLIRSSPLTTESAFSSASGDSFWAK